MSPGTPRRERDGIRTGMIAVVSRLASVVAVLLMLSGCSGPDARAPGSGASQTPRAAGAGKVHQVRRGETLYAIAWRYGTDYHSLARLNGIASPYTIYPGQRLKIAPARKARGGVPRQERRARTRVSKKPVSSSKARSRSSDKGESAGVKGWRWPTRGKVIGRFGASGGSGIDISGRAGQSILASAPGRVVYSGSGLRGYGKLIIIKHNDRYLSAYAHNEKLHAKEGDTVETGQRIGQMGQTGAKRTKLHFEIRRDGKPVDPLKYLPG